MKFIIAFRIVKGAGVVFNWYAKANRDGKVTTREIVELVQIIARLFGLPTEFKTPRTGGRRLKNAI